jgi:hypothetical protein
LQVTHRPELPPTQAQLGRNDFVWTVLSYTLLQVRSLFAIQLESILTLPPRLQS